MRRKSASTGSREREENGKGAMRTCACAYMNRVGLVRLATVVGGVAASCSSLERELRTAPHGRRGGWKCSSERKSPGEKPFRSCAKSSVPSSRAASRSPMLS